MYGNSKNIDCKKNSRRTPSYSESKRMIEVLVFKIPTDDDLYEGLQVCYKDLSGAYTKLGIITDTFKSEGFTYYLLHTAMGSYLADELRLINE